MKTTFLINAILIVLSVLLSVTMNCGHDHSTHDHSTHAHGDDEMDINCAAESRALTYVQDLQVHTENGHFTVTLNSSDPAPPEEGNNNWQITLENSTGEKLSDATIVTTPLMPDHGHGTTPAPSAIESSSTPGSYELTPVNLRMPGLWQVTLDIQSGETNDSAVFTFCIEG